MKSTKLLLIYVCLLSAVLSGCQKDQPAPSPTPVAAEEASAAAEAQEAEAGEAEIQDSAAASEPGTLLESGSGLNENYYKDVSYFGIASDLSDSSFLIGKTAMAFDNRAQAVLEALTIHYDENTVVKTAILKDDKYEIYAASLNDLELYINNKYYSFDIILEDLNAQELYAKEIRISQYILN